MTLSASRIADQIVVECPFCGAAESAAGALPHGSRIVCRECGETWNAGERPLAADPRSRHAGWGEAPFGSGGVIVAERRPLVSYSVAGDSAWAAKIEGAGRRAEPSRPARLPGIAGGVVAAAFLAAFFGVRGPAVEALPDLAGLYAAIGLPVHLSPLRIEDIRAERDAAEDGRLVVHATIRNAGAAATPVPQLAASLRDATRTPAGLFGFDPPQASLAPGASMLVTLDLAAAPAGASAVTLRFRRPGERLATAGAAELAALR